MTVAKCIVCRERPQQPQALICKACGKAERRHYGNTLTWLANRALRDELEEALAPHFDAVLLKHHPEAEFDYPGGIRDNDLEEEP